MLGQAGPREHHVTGVLGLRPVHFFFADDRCISFPDQCKVRRSTGLGNQQAVSNLAIGID